MPLEGHSMDCNCGCCDVVEEPQTKTEVKCICPSCGQEMPGEAGLACSQRKCPDCGAAMQSGV